MIKTVVLGTGGTGGVFAKEYAQFLASLSKADREKYGTVYLVDGDLVEKKNLARQPFIEEDIGFNKAEVLAQILNSAYGVAFQSVPRYITRLIELQKLLEVAEDDLCILIGCVDNHQARTVLNDFFHSDSIEECLYLDSANEFSVGEVITAVKSQGVVISPTREHYFPGVYDTPESRKSVLDYSCEELNNVSPQHKFTNMFAAQIMLSVLANMIQEGKLSGGITYFDTFKPYCQHYETVVGSLNRERKL